MQNFTLKERFMHALECKPVDKVPVCSVTQTGTVEMMELTGAKWPEAHYDAKKMASLAFAGYELANLEAVRFPFCTTVIAETLGCKIDPGTLDTQPYQIDFPCKNPEDIKKINIPENLNETKRISVILETAEILKEKTNDNNIPIICGMIGPAAIAFYLAGAKNYLYWSIQKPEILDNLMEIGVEICTEYANALFDIGIDAVNITDSEAGPDIFPPPLFESMITKKYKQLTSKLKGKSILHMCGDATQIIPYILNTGFEGLSIEEKVNVNYAANITQKDMCLIGNISPSSTLLFKSEKDVKKEAYQCMENNIGILAPGCGIAPHTPLENIKALIAARDEYYNKNLSL